MVLGFVSRNVRAWRYKNTTLLVASLAVLVVLLRVEAVHTFLLSLSETGYVGAFMAGMLFVSTFTVAPAAVVLTYLSEALPTISVALVAGAGAVVGDYVLFRFLKDRVFDEVRPLFHRFGGTSVTRIFSTPYFAWLRPVFGAVLIASPLPDELGILFLGGSRIKHWQFLVLTFVLNSVGIYAILTLAQLARAV